MNAASRIQPLVAVCICTRTRPQMLRRCLRSVARQILDGPRMAIVVIDNDPEASARDVFDGFFPSPSAAEVYVHCREIGIPIARNAAMDAAIALGGEYIVFLDDDEVAPPAWLQTLFDAMIRSGADALQGGVIQLPAGSDLEAAATPIGPVTWRDDESLATCNTIFTSKLAQPPMSLRFDEGMRFSGGSDRDFYMRASRRGAKVVRAYGVDVLEEVAPGRETLSYRCMRAFSDGCNYYTRLVKNDPLWRAAPRIVLRSIDRALSGVRRQMHALLLLILLRPSDAWRVARSGFSNFCFAIGCFSPLVGIRAYPYRSVQGA